MTKPKRALWLLNHTTLRKFEISILRSLCYEIFVPKRFPYNEENVSASITYEFDVTLTIPEQDLRALNAHNFYDELTPEISQIINAHFDIVFFGFFFAQLTSLIREFKGTLVLRPFGSSGLTYSDVTSNALGKFFLRKVERIEERFWFGQAYEHLADVENGVYRRKAIYLPVGLPGASSKSNWTGEQAQILFVCPRIETSPYYRQLYDDFKKHFGNLPHVIGGAQPIAVNDANVTGFLARAGYDELMQRARAMFYHSREKHHLHPLEAVRAGMPLLFMAGGMLDHLGGQDLPGRCRSIAEARSKMERVLKNDRGFIRDILATQARLLDSVNEDRCASIWRSNIQRIESTPTQHVFGSSDRKMRIAVIVPIGYRGGSLRGAKLLAQSIDKGARDAGASVDVVFAHLDDPNYEDSEFDDLPDTIERRVYHWRELQREEALRATTYAGFEQPLADPVYIVPDDGIQQFMDCDFFVIVSDRLEHPLLPVRPYMLMVYDYLQRYVKFLSDATNRCYIRRAHDAEAIMVTTDFTMRDAIQFAGLPKSKVRKVPMLAPDFSRMPEQLATVDDPPKYFIWTTNIAVHKNHENAFKALRLYYEKYEGKLECRVTGVGVKGMLKSKIPHLMRLQTIYSSSPALRRMLKLAGELPDEAYRSLLSRAGWLWHAARIDNGTFAVIEAAHFGIPSLSSDYPAMREIGEMFNLNLSWMDPADPRDMARQLKLMESSFETRRNVLPSADHLLQRSSDRVATEYWNVVREYL
jgi:glycosyltransferase involved in cell wall biosynthesis